VAAAQGVDEQVDPLQRPEHPVVVGRLVALLGAVVPVDDLAAARVDALRVMTEVDEPPPLLLAASVDRERGIDVARPDRHQAAREHADVPVVHVEGVERLRRLEGRPEELVDIVHQPVREVVVEEQIEDVLAVARPLAG
jgi:hypothetical protein